MPVKLLDKAVVEVIATIQGTCLKPVTGFLFF